MADPTKIPIRASTQEHLDIEDVREDIVILKDGGCVLVLATTAINFGLLSEREQDATIYAYAGMLNSLTFPLQILIRSQKKDISGYLKLLEETEAKETKKEIRDQVSKYKTFIKEIVAKNEVLDKKFYLVISMSALELGVAKAITSSLKRKKGLPYSKDYILQKAKVNLYPKRDHLLRQISRLGLKTKQLKTPELIQLFFEIYNPETEGQRPSQISEYQSPLVQTTPLAMTKAPTVKEISDQKPLVARNVPIEISQPAIVTETPKPKQELNLRDQINHLVKKST